MVENKENFKNILEVKNLVVSFQTFFGKAEAVRNISFNLKKGSKLAIVGESGCGKSVTANSIVRLLPKPPVLYKGRQTLFKGEDLLKYDNEQTMDIRGNQISMVFQNPTTSLNPTVKVGRQIVEGVRRHKKISAKEAEKLAIKMLDLVAVPQSERRIQQYPHEFPDGVRQRAMIALVMASKPELLIADEPITALNVTVQAQTLDLMKRLNEELGTSIILITHDLGVVADMTDEVTVMYAGRILEKGTVEEIFKDPEHPYTRKLSVVIPKINMEKSEVLHSIEGTPPDLYKSPAGHSLYDCCSQVMVICRDHLPELEHHQGQHCSRCWLNYPDCPRRGAEVEE